MSNEKAKKEKLKPFETKEDIWRYFVILLAMGIIKFPNFKHYWKNNKDGIFGVEYFSKVFFYIYIYN